MRNNVGGVLATAIVIGFVAPALAAPASDLGRPEASRTVPTPATSTCTIVGTSGDDVLVGTPGDDVVCGRGGEDVLRGGAGDDVLRGGSGDDVLRGWRGDDILIAGPGADALGGGPGADRLRADGDAQNRDVLRCGRGSDRADADAADRARPGCERLDQPGAPTQPSAPTLPGAPALDTGSGTATVAENGTVTVAPDLAIAGADNATPLTGATITLLGTGPGGETLALPGSDPGISAVFANDTLTLTGTASSVAYRDALRNVTFTTTTDAPTATPRTIRFTVLDDTLGTPLSGSDFVAVSVEAVNDAAVVTAQSSAATEEDQPIAFSTVNGNRITVSDPDAGTASVEMSLVASRGALVLGSLDGIDVTDGADRSTAVTIRGRLAAIDTALDGLEYRPPADASGAATLTMRADDLGNVGSGGALTDTETIVVAIAATNDAPTLTVPATSTLAEDTPLVFAAVTNSGLSVSDVDAVDADVTLTLVATQGRIRLGSVAGVSASGQNTGQVSVTGTVAALRAALDGTTFTPTPDYHGPAELRLTVDDGGNTGSGGAKSASAATSITVSADNDAPTLVATSASLSVAEDGLASVGGISVADVDADNVRVSLAVQHGRLSFGPFPGTDPCSTTPAPSALTAEGSPSELIARLATLRYCPEADYHGADALQIGADDLGGSGAGGAKTASLSLPITVDSVNDAPTGADRTLAISEDGAHTFAAADFGFSDPADSDRFRSVTLTSVPAAASGALELDDAGAAAGQSIPVANIPDLVFTPTADANGSPLTSFTFQLRDDGGTSDGGIDTDPTADTITIDVTPVNDAPSFVRGPDLQDVVHSADGQPQAYTIDPWASAVSAGPGEDDQTLSFDIITDDDSLFDVQPSVSPEGVLTFTPNPDEVGTANLAIRLADDAGTAGGGDDTSEAQTFTIETVEPGPAITSISPSPLVPGTSATLTGRGFSPSAAGNTVTIGGAGATVTGATTTTLTVTVPCVASDDGVDVMARVNSTNTNTVDHPLRVTQRDLAVGQSAIIDDASQVGCNEIASANGAARYVVAAYNTSTSPSSNAPIQFSADVIGEASVTPGARRGSDVLSGPGRGVSADAVAGEPGEPGQAQLALPEDGDEHFELLEENREQYEVLRDEFGTEGVQRRNQNRDTAADLPLTRAFRVSNVNAANICNNYYVASATRVYAEGKLVIYEDDATPADLKAANNPAMADYYDKIGDQFNTDMEPIVRDNFGDILLRDAVTDRNGVMVALSTPRLNTSFSGVAGFVVTCDQFPNDDTNTPVVGGPYVGSGINGASNFGEFFYLYQPTTSGTGYGGNTPDNWYRTIRSTFIHESKHVASQAARVANNAPVYEASWLEEGTARHAEELWARESVYDVPWKANTGYGTTNAPNSLYCDFRPSGFPECDGLPGRPSVNMTRHFTSLYTYLFGDNARLLSPFGPTPSDTSSYFYATSWSLVRYAIDRYATSDADFLTALTQSTSTGTTNLAQRTGVSNEQLLGRWALALSVDDYPGLTAANDDIKMPTWDFRDIYAGYHRDFPSSYTLPYPSQPTNYAFGSFGPVSVTTLRGGGVRLFQVSGTQTKAQLLRLQGNGGVPLPGTVRLAIVRIE